MTDRIQELLRENLVECLRMSDRTLMLSIFILFFAAVAAINSTESNTVTLPVGNVSLESLSVALWLMLGMHFVNALRYMYLLLRAREIAKRLDKSLLEVTKLFPAVATNSIVAVLAVDVLMVGLSTPILLYLFPGNYWMWFLMVPLIVAPFAIGNLVTMLRFNA